MKLETTMPHSDGHHTPTRRTVQKKQRAKVKAGAAATTKKGRVKGETVAPTVLLQMDEKLGVTRLAKLIGVSTTKIHNARRNGVVSKETEIACMFVADRLPEVLMMTAERNFALETLLPRTEGRQPFQAPAKVPQKTVLNVTVPASRAELVTMYAATEAVELSPENKRGVPAGMVSFMAAMNPDTERQFTAFVRSISGSVAKV